MKIVTRAALRRLAWLALFLLLAVGAAWWFLFRMPGHSFVETPPPATAQLNALEESLRQDVAMLAGRIGERNTTVPKRLARAAAWIETELRRAGYEPGRQGYSVEDVLCVNLDAERTGNSEVVVIGAHYDSIPGSPGANDNGSGVAATLALARHFARVRP